MIRIYIAPYSSIKKKSNRMSGQALIGVNSLKKNQQNSYQKKVDLDNRAQWNEQFDWIMDILIKMKKAYHYFALGALSGMPVSLYKLGICI